MERWEKNLSALNEKNAETAEILKQAILQNTESGVQVKKLDNGVRVLAMERNNYIWHMNSRLDPDSAANLYVERYPIKPFYIYFIFGFSDGKVIRKFLEKCDESNILLVYEPCKEILTEALKQYDLVDLFFDRRMWVGIPETWRKVIINICGLVEYSYIKLIQFCILPGYDVLYPEECKKYMDEIIDKKRYEIVQKETFEVFNRKISANALFHMKNMLGQRNCVQIKKILENMEINDIPAIIIAAGPSLDKNIRQLKAAEGKAFIVAVDAALKTVIREGIRPDLVCTIDPKVPERFFETVDGHDFLWSCSYWTNPEPIKKYGKKVFYYNILTPWWDDALQKELSYSLPQMETGGSVSAEAFQLVRYLGFKTIVFVGQDLAFTGGKSHTDGIKGIMGKNDEYIRKRHLVEIEGIDGEVLHTDFQMNFYREWFENTIEREGKSLKIIDATEGGAKIAHTKIQTLKETIEQECKREVNIREKLENVQPALSEVKQRRLYEKMIELGRMKTEFGKMAEECILLEKQLSDDLLHKDKHHVAFQLRQLMIQNEKLERHPFIFWISLYASKEEFEFKDEICAKEDMDIPEIMERSIRLMESYQAAIPLFEEDFCEIIMEEQKESYLPGE